jgi:hypothetical protein
VHVRGTEEGVGTLLRVLSAQMSDFRGLKGFALARESAFFKVEQVTPLCFGVTAVGESKPRQLS